MITNFKQLIKRLLSRYRAFINYRVDLFNHYKFSVRYHSFTHYTKDMMRCSIMLLNHQLEKAQTYSNMREGYGKQKVYDLVEMIERYIELFGADSLVTTSMGVLSSHFKNKYSYKDESIYNRFTKLLSDLGIDPNTDNKCGGVLILSSSNFIKDSNLLSVFESRRSCRSYSDESITNEEIRIALSYAMTAPSACNRQCVRAHYYEDSKEIESIIRSQKSDIDWCLKAKGLFIITANRSYFRDYFERNQRMFDAGLFSMNLVMGLHNQGIGSCFKMAQKDTSIDKNTMKIAGIPEVEDICVLLLIGKYPKDQRVYAKSIRLKQNEILTYHE